MLYIPVRSSQGPHCEQPQRNPAQQFLQEDHDKNRTLINTAKQTRRTAQRMEIDTFSQKGSSDEENGKDRDVQALPTAPSDTPSVTPSATPSAPSASPSASASDLAGSVPTSLPDSVRGAPEALKPAIRKKQNKESARRSRRRRKELVASLSRSLEILLQRTQDVETRLFAVEDFVAKLGFVRPQPAPAVSIPMPAGAGETGRGTGTESEAGSGTGRSRGQMGRGRSGGSEDDEVQRLIEKCIGQL